MKALRWLLMATCLLEFGYACILARAWLSQTIPPQPDLSHLHAVTRSEIRALQQQVIDDSRSAVHWEKLAEAYMVFGLFPEADWCAKRAVELEPESFSATYSSGLALNQLGRTSEAIERFERAITLTAGFNRQADPQAAARCWYCIGRNELRNAPVVKPPGDDAGIEDKHVDKAESAFREAGDFLPAQRQLAHLLIRSNRASEAMAILDRLVARHPNEVTFYQLRARARDSLGDSIGAQRDQDRATQSTDVLPSDMVTHRLQLQSSQFGLGRHLEECRNLMRSGHLAEAARRLEGYVAMDSRVPILSLLWQCEIQHGHAQQALELIQQVEETMGIGPERISAMGNAQLLLGRADQAVAHWQRAASFKLFVEPHFELIRHFERQGDATRVKFHRARMLFAEGVYAWRENQLEPARFKLVQSLENDPGQPHAWYYLGDTLRVQGKSEEARVALERCLNLQPHHGRARASLDHVGGPPHGRL